MERRQRLSVVVVTHDERRNLARCLQSVRWADERIVVDAGSTDGTVEVARRCGARVVHRPWRGYVDQKNFALQQARHEWVLSLDADEWLTAAGADEVRGVLEAPIAEAYAFNRLNFLSAGALRRTWSPDWTVRLFVRGRGRFAGGRVHESVRLAPGVRVRRLRQRMPHLPYRSIRQYAQRIDRYTDLAAAGLIGERRRVSALRLLFAPPAAFFKMFLLRGGFLDGVRGLVASAGSAFYVLLKYAKTWEASRPPDREFTTTVLPTDDDPDPAAVDSISDAGGVTASSAEAD